MTVSLKAGDLPHYVTIREKASTATANAYGERTPTYQDVVSVWAKVRPITARETERAKSFGPTVSHAVETRYRTDLNTGMQLLHRGRTLLFNGIVDADEAKVKLIVYCSELPAGVA